MVVRLVDPESVAAHVGGIEREGGAIDLGAVDADDAPGTTEQEEVENGLLECIVAERDVSDGASLDALIALMLGNLQEAFAVGEEQQGAGLVGSDVGEPG